MQKYQWSRLTRLQVGRYAEYFVKMAFTLHGFDVYSAEVDDKGIDFVVCKDEQRYYDVQVKSARDLTYIFLAKDKFVPRENLLAAIVLFTDGDEPALYLVPSTVWLQPNALFVSRDYEGRKEEQARMGLEPFPAQSLSAERVPVCKSSPESISAPNTRLHLTPLRYASRRR